MLHLYYGTDRTKVRDAISAYVAASAPPETRLTVIDTGNYEPGVIENALGGVSLFADPQWYLLDEPSGQTEFANEVKDVLAAMAESENVFLVLEGKLLAADLKAYQKHATEVVEHKLASTQSFNPFSLAEALAARDKRTLWLRLQEAKLNGSREEEVIGILWWQLKSLRLAASTGSAHEAGMKEFPYNKAKRALGKFPGDDIRRLSHSLLELYHAGHSGQVELDLALERWVLTL